MKGPKNRIVKLYRRFFHAILFFIAFVLIFAFYPRQGKMKYEYQKGKPWLHESLVATFDFPIMKSFDEINDEKDSLQKNFIPFFIYDPAVDARLIVKLERDLANWISNQKDFYDTTKLEEVKHYLTGLFQKTYQQGILQNAPESYPYIIGSKGINKVQDKMAVKIGTEELYSLKTAYQKIIQEVSVKAVENPVFLNLQQNIDFNQYLEPNLEYDKVMNEKIIQEMVGSISLSRGVVQAGTRIISQGEMVTNDNILLLDSYNQAYAKSLAYGGWFSPIMLGNLILVLSLMLLIVFYIQSFNRSIFEKKRNYTMILSILVLFFILTRLIFDNPNVSVYILPFTILPIIIRTFLGARMAIFIHFISLLLISSMVDNSLEFVFVQLAAGIVAVISLSKLHRRGNLFIAAIFILLTYLVVSVGFILSKEGTITLKHLLGMRWILISSFLVLIAYLIIYLIEKVFGFISDVTLMELSDTNHPLLRKLAEEAPGTFQHSMQVANLAEAVVVQTSGNAMLTRAGALYHDVGKIANSQYFIENQAMGQNPHEKMGNLESARKIINHVSDGVVLAKKYKIPESVIDFIRMHHGTGTAKYFYLKQKEDNPDNEVKEAEFMYPGPNPQSRETAILMLADGVEAASRSLPEKNVENLRKIIDQIIDGKIQNRELDDSPITFKDIKVIKSIFLEKLKNIYHIRIQYPKEG
jgi:cyclic-di-AMP phosphodiesterase PgpH